MACMPGFIRIPSQCEHYATLFTTPGVDAENNSNHGGEVHIPIIKGSGYSWFTVDQSERFDLRVLDCSDIIYEKEYTVLYLASY